MLDPKEERKYKRLRNLGQELHLPIPEHFIMLEVFDKNGKLIHKQKQRSHSWVRNAYNGLFSLLAAKDLDDIGLWGAGKLSLKDTGAAIIAGDGIYSFKDSSADGPGVVGYQEMAAFTRCGILVGSGVDAESFEDYVLQTPIAHGTGAGELNYTQSEPNSISYGALILKNTIVRYFNNNTVGETSVDVNEVALVSAAMEPEMNKYIVMSRDKLASTVTVPSTGQLKVTYTVQLTYPS